MNIVNSLPISQNSHFGLVYTLIATDDREGHGWKIMKDFSNYQTFIRNFINRFGGCKTTKVQPYRKLIFDF